MQACVPRFLPTQRSSTSRQCASRLPGVSPLPNARVSGYRASVTDQVAVHRGKPGYCKRDLPCASGQIGNILRVDVVEPIRRHRSVRKEIVTARD